MVWEPLLSSLLGAIVGISPSRGWAYTVYYWLYSQRRGFAYALVTILVGRLLGIGLTAGLIVAPFLAFPLLLHSLVHFLCVGCIAHGLLEVRFCHRLHHRGPLKPNYLALLRWSFINAILRMEGMLLAMLALEDPSAPLHYTWTLVAGILVMATIAVRWRGVCFIKQGWLNYDLILGLMYIVVGGLTLMGHFAEHQVASLFFWVSYQ
jgi:hypothetical protein